MAGPATETPNEPAPAPRRLPRISLVDFTRRLDHGQPRPRRQPRVAGAVERVKLGRGEGPAPRVLWLRDAIRRITIEWLARKGGYRQRTVAIGEGRRTGRLWSPGIWSTLKLSFTEQALTDLITTYRYAVGESRRCRFDPLPSDALGDLVFRHICLSSITAREGAGLFGHGEDLLDSSRSPLTTLFHPDLCEQDPDATGRLLQDDISVLLRYLDRSVALSWVDAWDKRLALVPSEAEEQAGRFADHLERFVCDSLRIERPDRLLVVGEFFRELMRRAGLREALIRRLKAKVVTEISSASERERCERTFGRIFAAGPELAAAFEEARGRSYVERSAADHLFLSGYHDVHRPVEDDIAAIARHLSGEIG